MEGTGWREAATDALRYWEPRRLLYNALLAVIVLCHAAFSWGRLPGILNGSNLLFVFVLAVLANVAYCAVYIADLFLQFSDFRRYHRRWRLVIALVGFAFAAALTHFCAEGLFNFPDSF